MVPCVKYPALLLLWCRFDTWPGNLCRRGARPKKGVGERGKGDDT